MHGTGAPARRCTRPARRALATLRATPRPAARRRPLPAGSASLARPAPPRIRPTPAARFFFLPRPDAPPIFVRLSRSRSCVLPRGAPPEKTRHQTMRASSSQTRSLSPLAQAVGALALTLALSHGAHAQASAPAAATAATPEVAEIQRLIKAGQNTQALKLIDDSLAKNPKDAAMRFRRGVTLSMLDRKAEALVVFQKLVEDHPEMPSPYNNLAVIYGSQGDYDKARAALEKAIRTRPDYATAYQNLGDVYAQLASQAYSKALQLDKSDTTVPPKLVLLRELMTNPASSAAAPARAWGRPRGQGPGPERAPAVSPRRPARAWWPASGRARVGRRPEPAWRRPGPDWRSARAAARAWAARSCRTCRAAAPSSRPGWRVARRRRRGSGRPWRTADSCGSRPRGRPGPCRSRLANRRAPRGCCTAPASRDDPRPASGTPAAPRPCGPASTASRRGESAWRDPSDSSRGRRRSASAPACSGRS